MPRPFVRPRWVIFIRREAGSQTIIIPWWQVRFVLATRRSARYFYGSQSTSTRLVW